MTIITFSWRVESGFKKRIKKPNKKLQVEPEAEPEVETPEEEAEEKEESFSNKRNETFCALFCNQLYKLFIFWLPSRHCSTH